MSIPANQISNVREVFEKFQKGSFSQTELRLLLIEVREFVGGPLREIADFVAHPERNRGMTLANAEYMHVNLGVARGLYTGVRPEFIPIELFDSIIVNLERAADEHLMPICGLRKAQVVGYLRSRFCIDNLLKTRRFTGWLLPEEICAAIKWATGFFAVPRMLFNSATLAKDLRIALNVMGVQDSRTILDRHRHEISVCFLAILHGARLRFADNSFGYVGISTRASRSGNDYLTASAYCPFAEQDSWGIFAVMETRALRGIFLPDVGVISPQECVAARRLADGKLQLVKT